jgi:UDP-glucose:(heptosyl)LPS alpha-1,3-glucosyltransferase
MRIAVISPFLDRTHGTERCLIEQLENFPLLPGAEIHIYAQRVQDLRGVTPYKFRQATNPDTHLFWHHVPAIPGPHLLQFGFWFFANRCCRWWDAKHHGLKFDLVYSPGINASDADAITVHIIFTEFYRGLLGQLSFQKTPVAHWPRLLHRRLYYRLIMALEKKIYCRPQVSLAAVSTSLAHQLQRSFQRQSVRVIHNGVDADSLSPSRRLALRSVARQHFALSPGEFVFLLIANDFKNKGLDALLCALNKLPEFQWRLLVVGRDERALYDRLIREYGIIHRVIFLAPSSDVLQFYAAADAYVGPSLQDAFGMPVLEAMSCGLPVLCSSRAGVSEIVTNGADGIILRDPQNAEEIAVSLRALLADPELARRLGEQAHLTAQKHTWNRNAQRAWEWLHEVLREKKSSDHAPLKIHPGVLATSKEPRWFREKARWFREKE